MTNVKPLHVTMALVIPLTLYFLSYFVLTSFGIYAVGCTGLGMRNGGTVVVAKWYVWYPRGFVKFNTRGMPAINAYIMALYAPLYYFDLNYWHEYGMAWSGRYPVIPFNDDPSFDRDGNLMRNK